MAKKRKKVNEDMRLQRLAMRKLIDKQFGYQSKLHKIEEIDRDYHKRLVEIIDSGHFISMGITNAVGFLLIILSVIFDFYTSFILGFFVALIVVQLFELIIVMPKRRRLLRFTLWRMKRI